ncbi:MAG TPA: porin [Tepidisphaeraceae bacterium]
MGGGGIAVGNAAGEAAQARFTRDLTNDFNYRVRGAISWDVRQQTEYGTLRTYIRFGAENTTPATTGGGTSFNPFWDRAFIQFAGFTVGRSQSFFDLVTYGGAYSYHNVRVSGDTGASGQNLWAYTAQFDNGFSGTLSLEDPATRKGGGTVDLTAAGFFGLNGAIVNDNAFAVNNANFGFRVPDIIANLRVDQQWGFAGISAALHDASGAYFQTPNSVINGHPADKYGWAVAGGAKFNLAGGDAWGFNVCYTEGAAGFCTNQQSYQVYQSNTSVGLGWIADGVFSLGQIELTRVWSALAFYEHIWNPRWRTSWFGGYVNVDYNGAATNQILQRTGNALAACGVAPVAGAATFTAVTALLPGNSCSPDYSFFEIGSRTQWNPVPQLDIGLEVLYTKSNTAFKGAAIVPANASRPGVFVIDDQDVWSAMVRWQRNFYP